MKSGFINSFPFDIARKYGLTPDPSVLRALEQNRRNRPGVRDIPRKSRGVAFGMPQMQRTADNAPRLDGAGTESTVPGTGNVISTTGSIASGAGTAGSADIRAGNTGSLKSGSLSTGNKKRGTTVTDMDTQTGTDAAQITPGKSYRIKHGHVRDKTVAQKADGLGLLFSKDDMLRGFIMAEVLGRPKCLRRGGGRI